MLALVCCERPTFNKTLVSLVKSDKEKKTSSRLNILVTKIPVFDLIDIII